MNAAFERPFLLAKRFAPFEKGDRHRELAVKTACKNGDQRYDRKCESLKAQRQSPYRLPVDHPEERALQPLSGAMADYIM
jgi:hypothetical protein